MDSVVRKGISPALVTNQLVQRNEVTFELSGDLLQALRIKRQLLVVTGRLWQRPAKVFVANRAQQNYSNPPIGADGLGGINQPLDLSFKLAEALLARERVRHPISQDHHRWLDSLQVLAQLLESLAGLIKVKGG